jgi:carboxyl-terminal processing protease
MLSRRRALASAIAVGAAPAWSRLLAQEPPTANWKALGDEVLKIVGGNFYDQRVAEAWARKFQGYADAVRSREEFDDLTRRALADLKVSHTGYFTPLDAKYYGLRAIFELGLSAGPALWDSPGADFSTDHFVRHVFADGPAAKAGLLRGDRVLQADGRPFHPVASFQGKAGQAVMLTLQRHPDAGPIRTALTPRRINAKQEWLLAQRAGARVIERNGKSAAYVPLFSLAGEEHERVLHEVLVGPLKAADGLVLDFRDGFGGAMPQFVNLFNRTPAALAQVDRHGRRSTFDPQWRKPVAILVNGGSTSGKEVVAHSVRKHKLGTLVGQPTAGAVLGGRCFLLADRSLVYLAVVDVTVDGERLEGRPVPPDLLIPDSLPFAASADPQLDKAVELATR